MQTSYREYVADDTMLERYAAYQRRYADTIRESDRVIVEAVGREITRGCGGRPRVLDVGCSTGNLLGHLHRAFPDAELHGADLAEHSIELCRRDPALRPIAFHVMDMTEDIGGGAYDIIIANAVAVYFDDSQYRLAMTHVSQALRPGGLYIAYEWLHGFRQDLEIVERSRSHPRGLRFHFRSYASVHEAAAIAGLTDVSFTPFRIPVDLGCGMTFGANRDGFEDLNTFTRMMLDGERLMYRGCLAQPWCHLQARRPDGSGELCDADVGGRP
jgi:SAM-dependent methyltransferase